MSFGWVNVRDLEGMMVSSVGCVQIMRRKQRRWDYTRCALGSMYDWRVRKDWSSGKRMWKIITEARTVVNDKYLCISLDFGCALHVSICLNLSIHLFEAGRWGELDFGCAPHVSICLNLSLHLFKAGRWGELNLRYALYVSICLNLSLHLSLAAR